MHKKGGKNRTSRTRQRINWFVVAQFIARYLGSTKKLHKHPVSSNTESIEIHPANPVILSNPHLQEAYAGDALVEAFLAADDVDFNPHEIHRYVPAVQSRHTDSVFLGGHDELGICLF